ncbi:MAG: DRTGG domain-containing protein [Bacteroidota bacterium]|nr:DRTGG domain-containing protein [Bacteroidota bacterium]
MKVQEIIKKLDLKVISGEKGLNKEISGGYVCDLLSDVMGSADEGQVWITLQTHKNIMAIASLKDIAAVILVKGLNPDDNTIEQSNSENIPILSTKLQAFEISGKLFQLITKN